jgi:hypothetical protein
VDFEVVQHGGASFTLKFDAEAPGVSPRYLFFRVFAEAGRDCYNIALRVALLAHAMRFFLPHVELTPDECDVVHAEADRQVELIKTAARLDALFERVDA